MKEILPPSYTAAYPEPKKGFSWVYLAIITTIVVIASYYLFYYSPKPTIDEQQTY